MSTIRQKGNAILNAMDEARVEAIIKLVDKGRLTCPDWCTTRYELIWDGCAYLGVKDIKYWLDEVYQIMN